MWGGGAPGIRPPPPAGMYGGAVAPPAAGGASSGQKHDIFVGNLSFNTTEEQLQQAFSEIGRVVNVRLVTDNETGKPRGFAFVEFDDPQAALSAIRNMNDYELNGRRLRVNFSNSSHLEALAGKLGMDLSSTQSRTPASPPTAASSAGTSAVADSLKGMSKGEMYDVVAKLKEIADKDPDEARRIISGHPQLPEALLFLMSKLDMVKTPIASEAPPVLPTPMAPVVAAPAAPRDPRAADPRAAVRVDPRAAARVDPRAAARVDPRAAAAAADPRARVAAAPPPAYAAARPTNLDPMLVQQVMSLTPQQIQQLPPDKQQSILQLRQQITGRPGI